MAGSSLPVICMLIASALTRSSAECPALSEANNKECYDNVQWAMTEGIKLHPQWYSEMPFLNESTKIEDFQYALATGEKDADGKTWNCTVPCDLSPSAKAHMIARLEGLVTNGTNSTGNNTGPGGMPAQYYLLIGLGVVLVGTLVAAGASYFLCKDKLLGLLSETKPAKKKRTAKPAPAPAAASAPAAPAPMPVVTHQVVLPTYQPIHAAPVHVAPPVYTSSVAQPVAYHAAPATSFVAAPSTSFVAAPMASTSVAYAPPAA